MQVFGSVESVSRALDYHLERHNVIASNVANVDTPGFTPLDLVRSTESSFGVQTQLALRATQAGHLGTFSAETASEVVPVEDRFALAGADGNAVSLEREMAKLAANDLRYETASKVVSRQLAMLRYAASDGAGG